MSNPVSSQSALNISPDKFGQFSGKTLSAIRVNKLISEDSLKIINFLDNVKLYLKFVNLC